MQTLKSRGRWSIGDLFTFDGNRYQFTGYSKDDDCWHALRLFGDKRAAAFSSHREWASQTRRAIVPVQA